MGFRLNWKTPAEVFYEKTGIDIYGCVAIKG